MNVPAGATTTALPSTSGDVTLLVRHNGFAKHFPLLNDQLNSSASQPPLCATEKKREATEAAAQKDAGAEKDGVGETTEEKTEHFIYPFLIRHLRTVGSEVATLKHRSSAVTRGEKKRTKGAVVSAPSQVWRRA